MDSGGQDSLQKPQELPLRLHERLPAIVPSVDPKNKQIRVEEAKVPDPNCEQADIHRNNENVLRPETIERKSNESPTDISSQEQQHRRPGPLHGSATQQGYNVVL